MAGWSVVLGVVLGAAAGIGFALVWAARRSRAQDRALRDRAVRAETELERQERSSADQRHLQDVVLSSMEEGVLLLDRDGHRVFSNPVLESHLGALPDSINELRPLSFREAIQRTLATGEIQRSEAETSAPSKWLRASAIPVGSDGSVLLVVRDVTEARRLEAVRRDFVANASHELKTPAASIRAAAETLRDGAIDDPPAAHRFTEQLEREAMRLSRIVSDLLDLSRLEAGSDLAERVRLDAVAADEIERLEDRAHEAELALELHADGVPSVAGSGRDLALLVRNLIDNAVRYTPPGGHVDVTVTTHDGHVLLRVADTGLGIPQRDLPRVFERFYRVDRARSRETGGTGLGLAIVKHVAENHGGDVTVTSELAAGSTFEVRLPVAGAARPAASERTAP
jgi:two-component system, OmpR family, phosphate regulon sensor histidine kinase PhoR